MSAAAARPTRKPRGEEADDDQPRQVDAEVAGRPRVGAQDLQPQAPGGARQHVVDDQDGRERDEQADVDPRPRDVRQHLLEVGITWSAGVGVGRILERALDQDAREVDRR